MATSEGDISLTAANIVAEQNVGIHAAGDLIIRSGQDTLGNANTSQSKAIGTVQISDTEKFSGWHRQQHEDDSAQVSQVASNIGSLGGSVNLSAGGSYSQIASNVVAAQDINITATSIELLTADETGHASSRDDDLKIGAFARVKSPLIDLINNVDAARQSDGRLQQMQGMAAAANAYQAASAVAAVAGKGGSGTLAAAEAGIGFKSASSSADSHSVVSQGSTLQAGGNLNLTSTGGDIHVVQGNLSAGNSLSLDSAGDILLEAGKSQLADRSQSSNAGAEVGMGASVGAQTGVYAYAEASVGSSRSNATSSTWHNTTLSGQQISLQAAGDTTLRGATATADRIDVTTGGTLTIESLQDVAQSESKNSQVGGRVQVSFGTAWDASGYASGGQADGNYQAVGEQSGLFAGDGGYHVQAGHVNLVGGAIASTHAGNSELSAQTLTFSDLHNSMDHQASSGSISGGFGGSAGDYQGSNTSLGKADGGSFGGGVPMTDSGSDRSTTHATLTEGNIVIGGQQTSAAALGINTDAAAAHRALDAMPNAEQQLADQQAMAAAVGTVVATSKQIAGDIAAGAQKKTQAAFDETMSGMSSEEYANFGRMTDVEKQDFLLQRSPAYRDAYLAELQWGIGGSNSRALEAVTTLLVGTTSGQVGSQVVANALAPYAAQLIGEKFDENHGSDPNAAAQLLSHALLGALLAEVNGGNAASGAGAAAGGELAAGALLAAYPNADRETISALSSAVGVLVGSVGGQEIVDAVMNSSIAGNAVENNRLLTSAEISRIKDLGKGDPALEDKLFAVACAEVRCWLGTDLGVMAQTYKTDSDEILGQMSPQDRASLTQLLKGDSNGLFGYGMSDYLVDNHWGEKARWLGSAALDFTPVIGDIRGYLEAENASDYIWATVGLVPLGGDIAKAVVNGSGRAGREVLSSPSLKGDVYNPDAVADRVKPQYKSNPAHDPRSSLFNPRKTPEPADAALVYQNAVRGGMGTWYGIGSGGRVYRYFYDNAGGVHFSGVVPRAAVPSGVIKDLGI